MDNQTPYQLQMQPLNHELLAIANAPVEPGEFPCIHNASQLFKQWDTFDNRILKSKNGQLLVACSTQMPNVTPAMIDWWFAWHLTHSERYQLWHPQAHKKATVKHDRSHLNNARDVYIDNVSYVDEYIGDELLKLSISFYHPNKIGLHDLEAQGATAICARTALRHPKLDSGHLVHLVEPTATGCVMKSVFWLGDVKLHTPLLGPILTPLINTALVRKLALKEHSATNLIAHCVEEMNHLPRFLPQLYQKLKGQLT
ncbi:DAPG hydrolase family protein [Shewanella youngdeokensis]|uniref:DAPG hydrolase PhiG domain-containing protein n=1 Tax=Shewanella youngdeokensis TaxID=2999068 RepID=A0ABZ0JXI6_9GAMM|nr:hypothetical protein RGE70_14270 [Shewanella sp. DAU334]